MHPRLIAALVILAAGSLAIAVAAARRGGSEETAASRTPFEGATMPAGVRAPDFRLHDEDGRPIAMRDFRGRPVIVTFLYTTCEDSCPAQAQVVRSAQDELGRKVPALAVAVDPPRDTPARARRFLRKQRMSGRLRWALGSHRELARVWRGFAIQPQTRELEHQARILLVDGRGFQRVGFPLIQATPERLAADYRTLAADG